MAVSAHLFRVRPSPPPHLRSRPSKCSSAVRSRTIRSRCWDWSSPRPTARIWSGSTPLRPATTCVRRFRSDDAAVPSARRSGLPSLVSSRIWWDIRRSIEQLQINSEWVRQRSERERQMKRLTQNFAESVTLHRQRQTEQVEGVETNRFVATRLACDLQSKCLFISLNSTRLSKPLTLLFNWP